MTNYTALDNDLYKFTMQQAVLHNYPDAWVKLRYQCRNPQELSNVDIGVLNSRIIDKIGKFCETRFQTDELHYLSNLTMLTSLRILHSRDVISILRIVHKEFR